MSKSLLKSSGPRPPCTFAAVTGAIVLTLFSLPCVEAQSYGLPGPRQVVQPYLNLPQTPPQPSGGFAAELAFPNLTFSNPVFMTQAPRSSQLYVCEREGRIWSFHKDAGSSTRTLVLDLGASTQGWDDCGLLCVAFHPEFGLAGSPNRGHMYVYYQYSQAPVPGPNRPPSATAAYNRLSRFTIPDGSFTADPLSELVLIHQHDRHVWHNGGAMFFHPVDGFLYLTIGDEGDANDSYNSTQKINDKLFSGVFRIDVDQRGGAISHPIRRQPQSYTDRPSYSQGYYIPNDNPWLDTNGSILEEFWALGVRSPHRMTFDPVTGYILVGDVGQGAWEEVTLVQRGSNCQWPYREGNNPGPRAKPSPLIGVDTPPLYNFPHGSTFPYSGNCVIGGYVYRGSKHPELVGKYLFGDNTYGRIWTMDLSTSPATVSYLCNMPSGSNYTGLSSFAVDSEGEIYLLKMNHTDPGAIYTLGRTGTTGAPLPATLSLTGAFANTATLTPAAGLIPYTTASPLWSDGADKLRWVAIPYSGGSPTPSQQAGYSSTGEWTFPAGTVFVKHFEIVVDEVSGAKRRLETRVLVRRPDGGVHGATYRWRPDNSDADLLPGALDETIAITTSTGPRSMTWHYPSRQECLTCHNSVAGHVLGVQTRQLNGNFTYPSTGIQDNQLRTWNHLGLLNPAINEASISGLPRLVPLSDASATLEHKVRSYLDANCSFCHRPGNVQAFFDARFDTPLASQGLIDGPVGNDLGIDGAVVVRPRDLNRSVLLVRDGSNDPAIRMPPLARNVVHTAWTSVLTSWIQSLDGLPVLSPVVISPVAGVYDTSVSVTMTSPDPLASILYTLDGSTPGAGSSLYTGPVLLASSATVQARATRSGFSSSVVSSAAYTVVNFRDPDLPPLVEPGVEASQYLGSFDVLPGFDALTPAESGVRPNFAISPRLQNDFFAFRFKGYVEAPEDGLYTFWTNSDDGSKLLIGGTVVVNNDGLHAPAEASGSIALHAGLHAVEVTFFEKGGGEVLAVSWSGPGWSKTAIPDAALWRDSPASLVEVVALDAQAQEPSDPAAFEVRRSGNTASSITVGIAVSGSASAGVDYTSLPTSVALAPGVASARLDVVPIDDSSVESNEQVIVNLLPGVGYVVDAGANLATAVIADNDRPVVTISAATAQSLEPVTPGAFKVSITPAPAQSVQVPYTVSGTATPGSDYVALSGSVVIPAGATSATIPVNLLDDALVEVRETVIVKLSAGAAYTLGTTTSATVYVHDDESVSVTVSVVDGVATEPRSDTALFRITRTSSTSYALKVQIAMSGTATNGTDYDTIGTTVSFSAGNSSTLVYVRPKDDTLREGAEAVKLDLVPGSGYKLGTTTSATITLNDND